MKPNVAEQSSSIQPEISTAIVDESGCDSSIFDGTATWPDLDHHFHNNGLDILQSDGGISAWKEAGGCLGEDGRWTFGYQSNRGKEILRELLQANPGILWTSTCGQTWAIKPIGDDNANASRAYGVSHPRAVQALDLIAQATARQRLENRLQQLLDLEDQWELEHHCEFMRRSQMLLQLRATEDAVLLLPYLQFTAVWERNNNLMVTAGDAAIWLPADDDEFGTDELGAVLTAASQIVLARFSLGQLAGGIKVEEQTNAVTRFSRCRDGYQVELSPLLRDVIAAFQPATEAHV